MVTRQNLVTADASELALEWVEELKPVKMIRIHLTDAIAEHYRDLRDEGQSDDELARQAISLHDSTYGRVDFFERVVYFVGTAKWNGISQPQKLGPFSQVGQGRRFIHAELLSHDEAENRYASSWRYRSTVLCNSRKANNLTPTWIRTSAGTWYLYEKGDSILPKLLPAG